MARRNRKYKLGLVGDSTAEHYPLEDLEDQDIDPIVLSCSPKKARDLVRSGRLDDMIHYTHENHPDLDAVFIFIGGNDVGPNCEVREILANILEIAQSFEDIGIPQIIMPLMNRDNPRGISVSKYTMIRNGVNRLIRRHYQRNFQRGVVFNMENLELKSDGVHLTRWSYRKLSRAIKIQLNYHTNLLPTGHFM